MTQELLQIGADRLRYRALISCRACQCSVVISGGVRVDLCAPEDLRSAIERQMPNIPVGWSMYGRDVLYCDKCTGTRRSRSGEHNTGAAT